MFFSRSKRTIFPLLPPYGAQNPTDGRIIPSHPDDLTPYLGLRARLSQVWINKWTILLLLVLVRVLIAIGDVRGDMDGARREALSACTSVESMGSAMASMPHYLSGGVNEMTASGIEKSVQGLKSMLLLTIKAVEEIIIFVLKIMYQTYACLITLAVTGTVKVGASLLKDLGSAVNSTLKSVSSDINKSIDKFDSALDKFADVVNKVGSALGVDKPSLDLDSPLKQLDEWHIPSSFNKTLDDISDLMPSFDEVENATERAIRLPFDLVIKEINSSLGTYHFDRSGMPVPAKKQLTFCDDNDGINKFFNGVSDVALLARKIFIIVLVLAAILACIPMAWREIWKWNSMKERAQLVRKDAHDPMDVVYIVSRPYTAATGIKAASYFSNSRRQILVRWAIAYATSIPALFVLAIALAALFACLCQYILLRAVAKTVPELSTEVGAFADKVVGSLSNASMEWATGANKHITTLDDDLNKNVFGWVNTSTHAINDTVNSFVDKTNDVLNHTFGGTILAEPVHELYHCLIGLKLDSLQAGLTWVSNHAHIDFPLLPNDTFSRGAKDSVSGDADPSSSFLADAGDKTSNKITEVVTKVVDKLMAALRIEAIIATCILLLWVFIALIGITRALIAWWGRDRNRGEGGGHAMDPVPNHPAPVPDSRGFTDVPLTAIPKEISNPMHPAPQYNHSAARPVSVQSNPFADEKVGYAGQRTYDSALQVDTAPTLRQSNYVEYDVKRG
ncbi:hypothetical protein N7492_009420 [Penicillium capsulatum]|uniref:Plasma membrane fusion protein PRM1 n=1 Tax=Penicillium capsulatum TaxID=69766 RepID=A0A9W9HSU4_9EURO|nr:hypothetical protein N7492_009420 [Penicillium capsulatum]KAJ6106813.1 hypothetical protein N7512_010330 [Penicillium capsulatum]